MFLLRYRQGLRATAPETGSGDEETMAQPPAGRGSGSREVTEQRREQILQAALEVIVERGYADTRIADVAERAGTSPALVIYYFKTRDQLLTEAIRYSEDALVRGRHRAPGVDNDRRRAAHRDDRDDLPAGHRPGAPQRMAALARPVGAVAAQPRGRGGPPQVRRAVAADHHGDRAGRPGGRRVHAAIDADEFAITLSALLDGMAVQIALEDPDVPPTRAYDLAMRYAAGQLGFEWKPASASRRRSQRRR